MAQFMTTKELSRYLKLHGVTICKYAAEGRIPAIRAGRVWRFDKDVIDEWIRMRQNETKANGRIREEKDKKMKSIDFRVNLESTKNLIKSL